MLVALQGPTPTAVVVPRPVAVVERLLPALVAKAALIGLLRRPPPA